MVRIVVVGSSGTYGYRLERSESWPAVLAELLAAEGNKVEVLNYASMGLPLEAYFERLLVLDEHLDPDAYVLQLPTVSRAYFGVNGSRKIPEDTFLDHEVFGWRAIDDPRQVPTQTRLSWTRGASAEGSEFFPIARRYLYPRCRENREDLTFEEFIGFLRFWDDNVADSDLRHVQHGKEIVALQQYLTSRKRPFCMFDWVGYNTRNDPRLGPFTKLIDFSKFVNHGTENVYRFLGKNWVGDPGGYKADEHGHLSAPGHRLLARRFLLPWIVHEVLPLVGASGA